MEGRRCTEKTERERTGLDGNRTPTPLSRSGAAARASSPYTKRPTPHVSHLLTLLLTLLHARAPHDSPNKTKQQKSTPDAKQREWTKERKKPAHLTCFGLSHPSIPSLPLHPSHPTNFSHRRSVGRPAPHAAGSRWRRTPMANALRPPTRASWSAAAFAKTAWTSEYT